MYHVDIAYTNGKAIQTLMFEGWNLFFKGGCIYNLNFFQKLGKLIKLKIEKQVYK